MAQIKANDRRIKMIAAIAGIAILGIATLWGCYSAIQWWNASTPVSQSSSRPQEPTSPLAPDSPDRDVPTGGRRTTAAASLHLANVSATDSDVDGDPHLGVQYTAGSKSASYLLNAPPMAETVSGPPVSPTVVDIAMHPSWKYNHVGQVASAVDAPSMQKAGNSFRLATFDFDDTGASVTRLEATTATPKITPKDAEKELQALIDANLKMEQDRRLAMSMCRDLRGCLWVGTEGGGVQRFDPSAPELHQWTQFTTKDGLGDDSGYAIACDRLGRIWVGHLNHGVSVFNGKTWQCYETVAGLSRPDTLSGPLGERVFHITVNPKDGDVWIATNCGLARYSEEKDTWKYYTRAEGLPSDEASSIAFDKDGNVYVATQCDGITMADANDDYKTWRTVTGPDDPPTDPAGDGLPTNLMNDLLMSNDGTLFVATNAGLALSKDRGSTWRYIRGRDWGEKVRNRIGGIPPNWKPASPAACLLEEDYCTSLAVDEAGSVLWIGHRAKVGDAIGLKDLNLRAVGSAAYVTCMLPPIEGGTVPPQATYGDGLQSVTMGLMTSIPLKAPVPTPSSAVPPVPTDLERELTAKLADPGRTSPAAGSEIVALSDDWVTEGDWLGRYGRHWACLAAMLGREDYLWGAGEPPVLYRAYIGPHHDLDDSIRYWTHWLYTSTPRSLELPPVYLDSRIAKGLTTPNLYRRQSENDDHGEVYPTTWEGPDLCYDIQVPSGQYMLSLYDTNKDGDGGENRYRDFRISIRLGSFGAANGLSEPQNSDHYPELAHARIRDFWDGVYKRFLVRGPVSLTVKVSRQYSHNTILAGLMLDPLIEQPKPYFPSSTDQQSRGAHQIQSVDDTNLIAAKHLLVLLEAMRQADPPGWALTNTQYYTLIWRYCERYVLVDHDQSAIARSALATCAFECHRYVQWEDAQRAQGLVPARDVEKSLRWNPSLSHNSGLEYLILKIFLRSKSTDRMTGVYHTEANKSP